MRVNEANVETLLRRAISMRKAAEDMRKLATEKPRNAASDMANGLANFLVNVSSEIEGCFIKEI